MVSSFLDDLQDDFHSVIFLTRYNFCSNIFLVNNHLVRLLFLTARFLFVLFWVTALLQDKYLISTDLDNIVI